MIGIVGGLGPYAHLQLERELLGAAARRSELPLQEQAYPSWRLASIPATPDRSLALAGLGPSPLAALRQALDWLEGTPERPGADFAVLACNSSYAWLPELRAHTRLPILDVVGETLEAAHRRAGDGARLGVLATPAGLSVYTAACAASGLPLSLLSPLDLPGGAALQEELVMTPIYGPLRDGRREGGGLKSGAVDAARAPLRRAASLLREAGAHLVIAACSEVPLALSGAPLDGLEIVDSMAVAAEACVAIAAGERPLPESGALQPAPSA